MDWDNLWGQAKEQLDKGWQQVQEVGIPVIKATVEKEALKLIEKQHADTKATLQQQVGALVNSGGDSTIGQVLKDAAVPAFFEKYKMEIVGGVLGIVVLGFVLAKGIKK